MNPYPYTEDTLVQQITVQQHYEEIVAEYNSEKDQVTIEQTFEALLKLVQELDEEDSRAGRLRQLLIRAKR